MMNTAELAVARHLEEMRRRGRRPGTITQRRYALARFARAVASGELLQVEADELADWVFREDLKPESQATEISHLRGFYRWCVDVELLDVDPTARLHRPALPRRLPRPMAEPDLATAIEEAPERIRPWLLLGAYAGLRCCDIAPLRAEDLWWDTDPALIIINDSKGGSSNSVAMSDYLADELRKCGLPRSGWLFRRRDGQAGHVPAHLVSQLTNRYLRSIGINATMHQTRHRFGTQVLRATGGNVRVAQEALRHASIASTQRYTYVSPTEVSCAVNLLPVAV